MYEKFCHALEIYYSSETDPNGPSEEAVEKRWEEIRSYIDVNRHLDGVDRGRYAAKVLTKHSIFVRNSHFLNSMYERLLGMKYIFRW